MIPEIDFFPKAMNYLLSFDGITEEHINKQLNEWKQQNPANMNDLFKAFLLHAQNRQGMPNAIGDITNLSKVLFDFDPQKTYNYYNTWQFLFKTIQSIYTPPGRMVIDNPKSYWVIYCKSILSIVKFLQPYQLIEDFNKFISSFYLNEYSKEALPLLLQAELFGFGFPLACDFLKENGYPEFIKPDTHIKDISIGLNLSTGESDYIIFKDMISYCKRINKLPYEVDKLFWLVGSGNFYLSNIVINSSKYHFINLCKSQI